MNNPDSLSALRDGDATERQTSDAEYSLDNEDRPTCDTRFVSMPKISRVPMAPGVLDRHPLRRVFFAPERPQVAVGWAVQQPLKSVLPKRPGMARRGVAGFF